MKYNYETSCVSCTNVALLEKMMDKAREITYETFCKYVVISEIKRDFGYDRLVSFYKSKFNGKKCVYMKHSGIEYIYTENSK
jgi:hypothetical protein